LKVYQQAKSEDMRAININQEWNFVVAETHNKSLAKKEILFALQILLCQIELITETSKRYFFRKTYSNLKEIYFS